MLERRRDIWPGPLGLEPRHSSVVLAKWTQRALLILYLAFHVMERSSWIPVQVMAVSLVLLSASAMLGDSLRKLEYQNFGFDPDAAT